MPVELVIIGRIGQGFSHVDLIEAAIGGYLHHKIGILGRDADGLFLLCRCHSCAYQQQQGDETVFSHFLGYC